MNPALTYTRVSSREQQQEGFSLGAQSRLLTNYAGRQPFKVVMSFEDVETAKTSGRKQFGEMIKWLKKNRWCRIVLVEKTDRLYRNFKHYVLLEELDVDIHFVKEGQIISKDSKSQAKLIHGLNVVLAKNYSDNLREEVKKGMQEKANSGVFLGLAPFGYRNNKAERTIEVDPVGSPMLKRMMELYATGSHKLSTLRKMLKDDFGKVMSKANVYLALRNRFYIGYFMWGGQEYAGTHQLVVDPGVFSQVQQVLAGHNRPHPQKREIAFRGLMNCAHDGCMLTGDVQKEKYVYYRCSASRGKCDLPRFREQTIAKRLGESLKGLRVPEAIVAQIVNAPGDSDREASAKVEADRKRLDGRLKAIQTRMDAAYNDMLP